ncbi:MAG TPA: ABC transporter permease [Blastocatellia bacterium]|nr:ABC transporter permease [Blastocatellia bacterium]HMV82254.1 ABC transporter permease [Blastocatellia bacterium]HMX27356.1 ABC transporter permease [Blastocatellia bacterium]HMY70906.1 ABC transporter permease [Blastocatellia bacterium]HMZ21026.1 ABC transporter permease [Blastocatellia bacterium]
MPALARVNFGDAWRVWRRNYDVYVRLWKTEIIAPLFEPVFSIIGFGWGVGSLVAGKVMGVPYLTFVGAGLLAFTALLRALFECTYSSFFRMVYQSTFDAVLCTPVEVESLGLAEIAWGASKALFDGLFVLAVLAVFGAVTSPLSLLIPITLTIGALWVAALSLLITSRIHDINNYNFYLAFVFSYLWISGAYFPLERMPEPVQWLAWAVPLTGAVDVSRQLMIGNLSWKMLAETLYLIVAFLVTAEFTLRSLRRRMVN